MDMPHSQAQPGASNNNLLFAKVHSMSSDLIAATTNYQQQLTIVSTLMPDAPYCRTVHAVEAHNAAEPAVLPMHCLAATEQQPVSAARCD